MKNIIMNDKNMIINLHDKIKLSNKLNKLHILIEYDSIMYEYM